MPIGKTVKLKELGLLIGDITILYGSLALMLFIRYGSVVGTIPREHFLPFSILFAVWILVFYIAGLYEVRSMNRARVVEDRFWPSAAINTILSIAFFYIFAFQFGIAPKTNLLIFIIIATAILYIWRSVYIIFDTYHSAHKRMLLIGETAATQELVTHLKKNPQLGYEVALSIPTVPLQNIETLLREIQEKKINLIAMPETRDAHIRSLGIHIKNAIETISVLEIYEMILRKIPLSELNEHRAPLLLFKNTTVYEHMKRIVELVIALLLACICIPVALCIALGIKITSPGSAFFTQVRVGKQGKPFVLWKFRTMVSDAEKNGPRWSGPDDTRVTPFGKFLRATHLDEMPQLWNIIIGNLSLVGPRPERPEFVSSLRKEIPLYDLRQLVRPGLTGWAQLNYKYGSSTEDAYKKLAYDLYYIKNRSLWLEVSTLLKTVKRFFVNA